MAITYKRRLPLYLPPAGDINTAQKRRAAGGIPKFKPGITPNASKDEFWRMEATGLYSANATVVVTGGLFMKQADLTGLNIGGPFFANPIG